MITAELSFRDYVPNGVIAIEFADVDFYGDQDITKKLDHLFHIIEHEKMIIYGKEIEEKENKIKELKQKSEENAKEIEKIKKQNTAWMLKPGILKHVKLLTKQNEENNRIIDISKKQLYSFLRECSYDAYDLKKLFIQTLNTLGFSNKSSSSSKSSLTERRIYEYPFENTQELAIKIQEEVEKIEKRIERQKKLKIESSKQQKNQNKQNGYERTL